jgi:hypothetical protein
MLEFIRRIMEMLGIDDGGDDDDGDDRRDTRDRRDRDDRRRDRDDDGGFMDFGD